MDAGPTQDNRATESEPASSKSYVIAAVLAGIFGIAGIHHFYVGRIIHGIFDLTLSMIGFALILYGAQSDIANSFVALGILFLVLDYVHTIYFMYKLIIGEYRDGNGLLIKYPGQSKSRFDRSGIFT